MNQSLQKAAHILEILMKGPTPVALTEFARQLEMPKSTASRFLSTMEFLEFVRRDPKNGKFFLGLKLFELGAKALADIGLRDAARPEMKKLSDRIDETILLTVMEGTQITYIDKVESSQAVVTQVNVGGTTPAHCVSSGKALISFDNERLEHVISEGLVAYTPMTITDPDALRQECEKIRKQGYALNKGEFRVDVVGVAAPIFNVTGGVVGAISTATPAARMNRTLWKQHIEAVKACAQAVSRQLGYKGNPLTGTTGPRSLVGSAAAPGRVAEVVENADGGHLYWID